MSNRSRILIVDDQESVRLGLQKLLTDRGHETASAPDAESALENTLSWSPDLIIVDLNLPGKDGLELVAELQERGENATVVVLTGHGSIESAIEATRRGVFDYLIKPVQPERLKTVIDRGLERTSLRREVLELRREIMRSGRLDSLIGTSPQMMSLYRMIEQVAPHDAAVLIVGESGTGKELVARTLHRLSPRTNRPFVAINCAAIPSTLLESEILGHEKGAFTGATAARAGCFERAHEGTILLDEIGEMPADLQSKLLRVLEDHKVQRLGGSREVTVDVRVLAATNAAVERLLEQGSLRHDLYFRLNVVTLELPPLRGRPGDIPVLAEHFLEEFRGETRPGVTGFSDSAMNLLLAHRWPGNVRELRNAVQRAVIICEGGEIQAEHFPSTVRTRPAVAVPTGRPSIAVPIGASIGEAEQALITETLRVYGGDKPKAASVLGISLKTLYTRLHAYGTESAGHSIPVEGAGAAAADAAIQRDVPQ